MAYATLKVNRDSRGVLYVTLNRPEVRNAFNDQVIEDLTRTFSEDAKKNDVRAVVLAGEGASFCAGGDLNWMKRSVDLTREENLKDTRKLTEMFALMNECPKPLIGAVQGHAIGGGVGLVSVCDIVVAVQTTEFSLSEVRLGIVPACIGPFVVSKIGASHARGLFVSAERFQGAKAREIGLVHECVEDHAALQQSVERILGNILQCGPNAIGVAKRLVLELSWPEHRKSLKDPLGYVAEVLADLRVTPEGQEGVRAFLEKRKPSWLVKK
ncbi:MAG: enoyl-CoA hydratase/isomerase family protein [Bdellovibrio sp.]|nr:enoyl-CoA hydratase/isomerase family protein [Bdellovibrio sp.]